ncbi:response regulator [Desulfomonile tiedjei]|uniref:Response regulator containing a CheY-like receiver domain and an HD-GYP domain n=1 Tax=Desulfomonile tiedjei (strain ATCC 49306 / DSM 6799 / DCB-1) TaxID=706587 RepID=I4C8F5_DESTA|nr:response regulator [Desulfomonile tiedjei]AFM25846.1 response regulator containing a CheY-like receiver domain and an HD-GYP domain [Desulfomonile tiedjei DSM 6799]
MINTDKPLNILLVEDNPMDVLMTKEALQNWTIEYRLHVVENGEDALDFVYARGDYAGMEQPDMILLDLNLPKLSGKEILSQMQQDPDLSNIPVVVVTTADASSDFQMCLNLGAKLFITKPIDFEEYVQAISTIQDLWLAPTSKDSI